MTKIPTTQECMILLDEFEVPENIRKHSFAVNKIAMFLAEKLKQAGENINLDLINAASLLHDIDKIATLKDINKHAELGCEWLSQKEHKIVGEVVKKHRISKLIKSKEVSWEDKIVNYADKRCLEDKLVSLDSRFGYIRKRYPGFNKQAHIKKGFEIEKEIFDKINMKPEDIE